MVVSSLLLAEFLLPLAEATDAGLVTGPGWRLSSRAGSLRSYRLAGATEGCSGVLSLGHSL